LSGLRHEMEQPASESSVIAMTNAAPDSVPEQYVLGSAHPSDLATNNRRFSGCVNAARDRS